MGFDNPSESITWSCFCVPQSDAVSFFASIEYFFFNNERPGPIAGSGNNFDDWPSLGQAGFGFVDAIISGDPPEAHFFCLGEAAPMAHRP